MSPRRSRSGRGSIYIGVATGLFVTSGAFVGGYFLSTRAPARAQAATVEKAPGDAGGLAGAVTAALDKTVKVKANGSERVMRWSELGVVADADEMVHAAGKARGADPVASLTASGAMPVKLDRQKALDAIAHIKATVDRSPINAALDLEARTIKDETPGFAIDLYGSLDRIEAGARTGAAEIELAGLPLPAHVTRKSLGIDDISQVMGHWKTTFGGDPDRAFNLKLAASHLNGYVLQPGVEFSFNGVVGERSEKQGYKIAHVITAGEMVDGLAGGTCQISTTLFGASFFAGLDILKTTNHSRPSVYVTMGLDATVVWPNTDLVMKNPYDFPVVIHYRVARGEAEVEILGKKRPWDEIAFERVILEETPYESEDRPDDTMAEGTQTLDQAGFDGYKILRLRKFYKGGQLDHTDKWTVIYKPVTEYVRKGTSTDPDAKIPEDKELHGPKPPGGGTRIVQ